MFNRSKNLEVRMHEEPIHNEKIKQNKSLIGPLEVFGGTAYAGSCYLAAKKWAELGWSQDPNFLFGMVTGTLLIIGGAYRMIRGSCLTFDILDGIDSLRYKHS